MSELSKLNSILDSDGAKKFVLSYIAIYTDAFNHACELGWSKNFPNKIKFQNEFYALFRSLYGLKAQVTCSMFHKAFEAIKATRAVANQKVSKAPRSEQQSIRYNKNRSYSILNDKSVDIQKQKSHKILSIDVGLKRIKIPITVPLYHQRFFENPWELRSAELVVNGDDIYLHIGFRQKVAPPQPTTGNIYGLDLGQKRLAVTSKDNVFYNSSYYDHHISKLRKLKSELQKAVAKGSRSAKIHLDKLKSREKRFTTDYLHCRANEILNQLQRGDTLTIEDLTYISKNFTKQSRKFSKKTRTKLSRWAFAELRRILEYKAIPLGIVIKVVSPAYTSINCSCCGFCSKRNRISQSRFKCRECGYDLDADLNGARNIAAKGQLGYMPNCRAPVNEPRTEKTAKPKRLRQASIPLSKEVEMVGSMINQNG